MKTRELVKQAVGDPKAFEELVRRYSGLVYSVCYGFAGNGADAEDLAQQVWLTAYEKVGSLREAEKFPAWLRRVAANTCKMWLRESRSLAGLEEISTEAGMHAPESGGMEVRVMVNEALHQVAGANRLALLLRYLGGYSHKEIAKMLGVTEQKVKSRLHEGKKQLKARLLAVVEEMLAERFNSEEMAKRIVSRCQAHVCECASELIDG